MRRHGGQHGRSGRRVGHGPRQNLTGMRQRPRARAKGRKGLERRQHGEFDRRCRNAGHADRDANAQQGAAPSLTLGESNSTTIAAMTMAKAPSGHAVADPKKLDRTDGEERASRVDERGQPVGYAWLEP